MPAVKISPVFQQINHWENFAAHFYNYKVCGELPSIFGRDERLDLSDMHHIHLAGTARTQARWAKIKRQYYRTTTLNDPDNDFWLVYAYDDYCDSYLLLTIMGPDAHSRAEWGAFLRTVHNDLVTPWILGRISFADLEDF
ncbi:type II toxin-antitoxin system YafO family toxin [Pseudomonas poae]|uniref:Type II toxin-antitoxin system YafO family toxin n=1 Tax=Pseudomonas poae TaxID=200451 RepID=A0A7M1KA61_9PSED|nr:MULTISPECIES: type II toxin-antitoxin system YafO family toxin [Pseudomonas]NWA82071.1 type II toxin-antitoxin system YafO family toxin [Pseudomonas sp. D2002]QOQ73077.1 type II toxin-antitoxin system YafO family toxin [Pseudomonas poae]